MSFWKTIGQFIGIVAGILLAFAIDAWWEAREENDAERTLLEALQLDLERLQESVDRRKRFTSAIRASAVALLKNGIEGTSDELTDSQIDQLIGDLFWYHPKESLQSGPLVALIDGGEIRVVSNPRLRMTISNLYTALSNARGQYENDEDFHHRTFFPYMIENSSVPRLTEVMGRRPSEENDTYGYPDLKFTNKTPNRRLLDEPRFRNLLVGKIDRQLDIQNYAHPLLERELLNTSKMVAEELLR